MKGEMHWQENLFRGKNSFHLGNNCAATFGSFTALPFVLRTLLSLLPWNGAVGMLNLPALRHLFFLIWGEVPIIISATAPYPLSVSSNSQKVTRGRERMTPDI